MSKTDFEKVQNGDFMAIVQFVQVKSKTRLNINDGSIRVKDVHNGFDFDVNGKELVEQMYSANRFNETKKVTRTELAEIFTASYNRPFTVVFKKANGDLRTLIGKLNSHDNLMGRSYVTDLEVTKGTPIREVCHRTLQSLIVDGVKYEVKK